MISNAVRSDKKGTHWWRTLHLHPKKEIFLFESFGLKGIKNVTIQDNRKIINKILFGLERSKQTDRKLTLVEKKSREN